ncbi:hypothetical protein EJ08DRAFT_644368 [Tothia fuscella]|uniref:WW domain-containing protein n=1 Tax=Tothia fuscella TaxID=1048955 RepID=A0A9P4U499_9PEZI|nr:hypothetical protein EJ08DRAFT_644368 [Tothia fuscella]
MVERESHDQLEEGEEVEEILGEDSKQDGDSDEATKSSSNTSIEKAVNSKDAPPLPDEEAPPLPDEEPPDDGWAPVWDETAQAFYFYNRFTHATQWDNPRVPETSSVPTTSSTGLGSHDRIASSTTGPPGTSSPLKRVAGGYNPAIHGDYDENADYAIESRVDEDEQPTAEQLANPNSAYAAKGAFNRFTGKWQAATLTPDNFNDEHKSKRQMNAFFDVDAAANSHDGKSLKAERQGKKLSKDEVKAFKEKRRAKKEEKRRAWLRD